MGFFPGMDISSAIFDSESSQASEYSQGSFHSNSTSLGQGVLKNGLKDAVSRFLISVTKSLAPSVGPVTHQACELILESWYIRGGRVAQITAPRGL